MRAVPLLLAASTAFTISLRAASPHDVTTYGVVYRVPAMKDVVERKGLPFTTGLVANVALPPKAKGVPAVVFVNGVGGPLQDWEIYRTWGRLVAAHGLAGVTFQADPAAPGRALPQVVQWLEREGPALGIDPSRIALWSCSANVSTAMPYQMDEAPKAVKAAVVYYGNGAARTIRKDLPVYYVQAGRDGKRLIDGARALWARAIEAGAPWTMVSAPTLTHAFDALDEGPESVRVVKETIAFLVEHLRSPEPPKSPSLPRQALTHVYGQEPAEAAAAYRAITEQDPKDGEAFDLLGLSLTRQGKSKEALVALDRALELGQTGAVLQHRAQALLADKQYAKAAEAFEQVIKSRGPSPPPFLLYNLACAYALAGNKTEALDRLEKAVAGGFRNPEQIASDEDLLSLRGEARFQEMLSAMRR